MVFSDILFMDVFKLKFFLRNCFFKIRIFLVWRIGSLLWEIFGFLLKLKRFGIVCDEGFRLNFSYIKWYFIGEVNW